MEWPPSSSDGWLHAPPRPPVPLRHVVTRLVYALSPHLTPHRPPHPDPFPVAIFALPSPLLLPAFLALATLRATPLVLHPSFTASDLGHVFRALPCPFLLTASPPSAPPAPLHSPLSHLPPLLRPRVLQLSLGHDGDHQLCVVDADADNQSESSVDIVQTWLPHYRQIACRPADVAAIFFTSGTTAGPKPVPLTPTNLLTQARAKLTHLDLSSATIYLHLAPLHHLGGMSSTLAVILARGTHLFPPSSLSLSRPLQSLSIHTFARVHNPTLLVAVPASLRLLLDAVHPSRRPLPSVRTVLYGGAPAPPTLLADLATACPNAAVLAAYGMTETASTITLFRHASPPGPVGPAKPLSYVRLAVMHPGGRCAATGVGEVLTRGPHVFPGYLGYSREDAFTQDGWFRTGDIGRLHDDGTLVILGRRKDTIRTGGESVFPAEVERVLLRHDAVREAAVVGLPHRVLGEAVAACVVLAPRIEEISTIPHLTSFCRAALATFKCPRWILATDDLPRNATGKVVKTRVREILQTRLEPRAKL